MVNFAVAGAAIAPIIPPLTVPVIGIPEVFTVVCRCTAKATAAIIPAPTTKPVIGVRP